MRVAFIHPAAPGADGTGAVQTATLLVRGLIDQGHEVTVLCRRGLDGTVEPGLDTEPLDTTGFPYHTATLVNDALARRGRNSGFETYDIVHSYLPTTIPGMATVGAESPAGTVITLNAFGGVCPKNDLRYRNRTTCRSRGKLRCATCSIATSGGSDQRGAVYRSVSRLGKLRLIEQGLSQLTNIDQFQPIAEHVRDTYAAFGFPQNRMTVVPTPVDERFLIDHRSTFETPYRLLFVGYLEQHKGVDRLLPMLERVRDAGLDVELTIVGTGGQKRALHQDAARRDLEAIVEFTGRIPNADLPEVYASHDLFVYPGRWEEPRGRVFLEALATGTPIVATDVGAAQTLVGDAGIVTPSDIQELADGVVTALTERDLSVLSQVGRDQVTQYRPASIVSQLETAYEEVIAR